MLPYSFQLDINIDLNDMHVYTDSRYKLFMSLVCSINHRTKSIHLAFKEQQASAKPIWWSTVHSGITAPLPPHGPRLHMQMLDEIR